MIYVVFINQEIGNFFSDFRLMACGINLFSKMVKLDEKESQEAKRSDFSDMVKFSKYHVYITCLSVFLSLFADF